QRYDCDVCLENLDSTSFYNRKLEIRCGHLKRVCVNCVQNWISSTLEANGPVNICCPLCPQELRYDNIRSLAAIDTFTRYDILLTKRAIETTQPNFQPCTHAGCDSGQIHETGHDQPIMMCISCHKLTCFTHKQPWHTGMTCTDFDSSSARLAADLEVETLKIIDSTTKKCPGCEVRIQKNDG
ncbi:hypothetical protein B0J14DRAFT_443098, partial [Halenospora varia]